MPCPVLSILRSNVAVEDRINGFLDTMAESKTQLITLISKTRFIFLPQ